MSFTAEVKEELSRVEGDCLDCPFAELSALIRVCGTLSFRGNGRYQLRISTETGAVARTVIKLTHKLFDLDTQLVVRRSVLHKTRNYLIEMGEGEELASALDELGILVPGRGLNPGVPSELLQRECCQRAFVRGAFMAGGFIADPRGDFHLEIAVTGEEFAQGVVDVLSGLGVSARLNHRRGAYAIYLKSYEDIEKLLVQMGAVRTTRAVAAVRQVKSKKNNANRRVNAEMANLQRASQAAVDQRMLVADVERSVGVKTLPRALREFCFLRLRYPEESLAELGRRCDPPVSKSAMYHRLLRLQKIVEDAAGNKSANGLANGE